MSYDLVSYDLVPIVSPDPIVTVVVPVRTVSELNRHEHWRYRQKRAKEQRRVTWLALIAQNFKLPFPAGPFTGPPVHVHLTRLAPRKLDSDNAVGALKHVRDEVAVHMGCDDGDESKITWSYGPQEKSKEHQVRIEFYVRSKE